MTDVTGTHEADRRLHAPQPPCALSPPARPHGRDHGNGRVSPAGRRESWDGRGFVAAWHTRPKLLRRSQLAHGRARRPQVTGQDDKCSAGCVTLYQANFGRVCCDLASKIQHLYANIYALYHNCVQTSRTTHLYPAYKLINLRIFNTTGLFFRLKRSKKDPFLVHNSCGAWPAAPASDDQQMQLWALAATEARPLVTDLEICWQAPLRALPANQTIHLYPPYRLVCQQEDLFLWLIQVNRRICVKCCTSA